MMTKRDYLIMQRLREHLEEAFKYFSEDQIVGIFLQGSQNYGLDIPGSDVDTKLIVVPSLKDIAMNAKPISTTHIRANEEHIDFKDIRLYMETFRKQNLNFLEILFTKYFIINPIYFEQWNRLVEAREDIANFNRFRGVQSMKGVAMEKYHAMEHRYPSKIEIIDRFGYDPKQLHHLRRIELFMVEYIESVKTYEECLHPDEEADELKRLKLGGFSLQAARYEADAAKEHIEEMAKEYYDTHESKEDPAVDALLKDVQYQMMKIAVRHELEKEMGVFTTFSF